MTTLSHVQLWDIFPVQTVQTRYDGYKGLFSAFLSNQKVIKWYDIMFLIDRNVFNWSVSHIFDVINSVGRSNLTDLVGK